MCLHIASIEIITGNKTRFFPKPFLDSTSWLLILAKVFRNDHEAAFITALRSATEKMEWVTT